MLRYLAITATIALVLSALPAAAAPGRTAPSNTEPPSISGSTTVGQTLSATAGAWDGQGGLRYTYQWQRCDSSGAACAALDGATDLTYTSTSADVGSTLSMGVVATNNRGSATAVSDHTAVIAPPPAPVGPSAPPPAPVGPSAPTVASAPTISGSALVGQTLTSTAGIWNGSPTSYAYQWFYCDSNGANCVAIVGATTSTYQPVSYDVGGRDKARVTATNSAGSAASESAPTAVVVAATASTTAISPAQLPGATVGSGYSTTLSVAGSTGPYAVKVTGGALPPGLALGTSGLLSGTPSVAGSSSFTVTAYITTGAVAVSQGYSLSVATASPASSSLSFFGDPSQSSLGPWDNFDLGTGTVPVSSATGGGTLSPGSVRSSNGRYELTVTPTSHASPASSTDSVYLWNQQKSYLGNNGQDTWEHYTVTFPGGGAFAPNASCGGGCPWFAEHHNNDGYLKFYNAGQITWEYAELSFGIITDHTVADGSVKPQIFMRAWGGQDNTPSSPNLSPPEYVFTRQALQYDHAYDIRTHVVWSSDGTVGQLEWWLDGQLIYSKRRPTLWRRPDGTTDVPNFEFVNYRPHDGVNSTIYFGPVKIGSTSTSVN